MVGMQCLMLKSCEFSPRSISMILEELFLRRQWQELKINQLSPSRSSGETSTNNTRKKSTFTTKFSMQICAQACLSQTKTTFLLCIWPQSKTVLEQPGRTGHLCRKIRTTDPVKWFAQYLLQQTTPTEQHPQHQLEKHTKVGRREAKIVAFQVEAADLHNTSRDIMRLLSTARGVLPVPTQAVR